MRGWGARGRLQYLGFGVQRRVVVVRQTRRSRDSNPSRASKSSSLTLSSHTGRSVKGEKKRKKKKRINERMKGVYEARA